MRAKQSAKTRCDDRAAVVLPKRKRRQPVFDLTPAQIFARCQEKGRCQICAGEALTLRDLMQWFGWTIAELAECSQVSRAMISAILRALKFPTVDIIARLAACFGLGCELESRPLDQMRSANGPRTQGLGLTLYLDGDLSYFSWHSAVAKATR